MLTSKNHSNLHISFKFQDHFLLNCKIIKIVRIHKTYYLFKHFFIMEQREQKLNFSKNRKLPAHQNEPEKLNSQQSKNPIDPVQNHLKQQTIVFSKFLEQLENLNNSFNQFKIQASNHFAKITKIQKNIQKNEKQLLSEITELKGTNKVIQDMIAEKLNYGQNIQKINQRLVESVSYLSNIQRSQNNSVTQLEKMNSVGFSSSKKSNSNRVQSSDSEEIDQPIVQKVQKQKKNQQIVPNLYLNQNCQYKDRQIVIPFTVQAIQNVYDQKQKIIRNIERWTGQLYYKLAQETFVGYYQDKLTQVEMRVFFSHNLILNAVKLMDTLKKKYSKSWISHNQLFITQFEQLSQESLKYLISKFPQKKNIFIKPQLEKLIQTCEITEDPEFNILKNLQFSYKYEPTGRYDKSIKEMLNKLVDETTRNFKRFREQMKKIFLVSKTGQKQTKYGEKFLDEDKKLQQVQNKIGMKFSENSQTFSQKQIYEKGIKVKSPQILRIIIKWILELEQKIENPDKFIKNRYFPFVSKDRDEIKLTRNERSEISEVFASYFKKYNQRNYLTQLKLIQSKINSFIEHNQKHFSFISKNNVDVGLTTCVLSHTVSDIAIKYLSDLIHGILTFQESLKTGINGVKPSDPKLFENFSKTDYITFSIYDLLRAKCVGTKEQIFEIYKNIKNNENLKIVRAKNRLNTGNRDFLLNLQLKGCSVLCQLQLALISEKKNENEQKYDYLDHFNHFLYELARSKYGSLTQASILNFYFTETISFFSNKLQKIKQIEKKNSKLKNMKVQLRGLQMQVVNSKSKSYQNTFLYVCENCYQIKYPYESFLKLFELDSKYFCGQCALNALDQKTKKLYLLNQQIQPYFQKVAFTNKKQLDKLKDGYYIIIEKKFIKTLKMFRKLDQEYVQTFSNINDQKIKFYSLDQLNIDHIFKFTKQFPFEDSQKMRPLQVLNSGTNYVVFNLNVDVQLLKQASQIRVIYDKKKNIPLILDCNEQGYKKMTVLDKGNKYVNMLINSKIELWDLQDMFITSEIMAENLSKAKHVVKRLNLSHNNIKNLQFLESTELIEINLNKNELINISLENISFQKLEKFNLSSNKLKQFIIHKNLPNLALLKLNHNELQKIDFSKSSCICLKQINLSKNQLIEVNTLEDMMGVQTVEILKISDNHLRKINLNNFTNLKELDLARNDLIDVNINLQMIEKLDVSSNKLTKLILTNCSLLKILNFNNNEIQSFSISSSKVEILDGSYNKLTQIKLSEFISLTELYLNNNNLYDIVIQNPTLKKLMIFENQLKILDLSKVAVLNQIDASHNQLNDIQFGNISDIVYINLSFNKLKELNIQNLTKIEELTLSHNYLEKIIFPESNLSLYFLDLNYNRLSQFTFKYFTNLQRLTIKHNLITYLSFSISQGTLVHLNLSHNLLQKIDFDDSEFQNLTELDISYNKLNQLNFRQIQFYQLKLLYLQNNFIKSIKITKRTFPNLKFFQIGIWKTDREAYAQWVQKIISSEELKKIYETMRSLKKTFIQAVEELKIVNENQQQLHNIKKDLLNEKIFVNSSNEWFRTIDKLKKLQSNKSNN